METRRTSGPTGHEPLILVSGATATRWPTGYGTLVCPSDGSLSGRRGLTGVWAVDNGAYGGFDRDRFLRTLDRAHRFRGCEFVACPDVVGDWAATLRRFVDWAPRIRGLYQRRLACVAQDGVTVATYPWDAVEAVFLGGSTAFKLGPVAADLASYAKARGKWLHMGRVNTGQRYRYAAALGVNSVDGTLFSRFPDEGIRRGALWRQQLREQPRMF